MLLAVAAGLALAALPLAVSRPGVVTGVDIAVLLGMGALLPERPWRTGVIVATPGVLAGLLRAAVDGSEVPFPVLVLASPVALVISGLIVKVGAALVERRDQDSSDPRQPAPRGDGRRRRPFETKAQRARFLVLLTTVFVIGSSLLDNWGAGEVDEAARRREAEIRSALEGRTAEQISTQGIAGIYGDGPDLPGGPYRWASPGSEVFQAPDEVRRGLQYRCLHVRLAGEGPVEIEIERDRCDG